jgi:hypothetical protein
MEVKGRAAARKNQEARVERGTLLLLHQNVANQTQRLVKGIVSHEMQQGPGQGGKTHGDLEEGGGTWSK